MLPLHQLLYSSSLAPIVLYLVRTVRQATVGTRRVPDILPFAINGKQVLRDIENTLAQRVLLYIAAVVVGAAAVNPPRWL